MILAAGRGKRMRPLTDNTPKPLLQVGGRPLIEYHLVALSAAGINRIIINHAHLGEQIENALGDGNRWGVNIIYSPEPEGALETGGGIFRALPLIDTETFIVVNGDIWSEYDFSQLNCPATSLAHLVLVDNPPHNPTGDFSMIDGRAADAGSQRLTFSGIGAYRAGLFASCSSGSFSLTPLLRMAMEENRVTAEHYCGHWTDVGTPERLSILDRKLNLKPAVDR